MDVDTIRQTDFKKGSTLLIDKPIQWTSFDVVNKIRIAIRKQCGEKVKVGHAGTLDPLATGLLIICTGQKTKTLANLSGLPKAYEGIMQLGGETPSFDLETEVVKTYPTDHIKEEMVSHAVESFKGEIQQMPPVYSAIKQGGKPLYKLARAGKNPVPELRKVLIEKFEIATIDMPEIHFSVSCSKGTYIRSLVHDFGKSLHSGAYLKSLRRIAIGQYKIEDAVDLFEFVNLLGQHEN